MTIFKRVNSLPHNLDFQRPSRKRLSKNTVGKGENADDQHFLLYPVFILLYQREKLFLAKFNLSSTNAFNLVEIQNFAVW